jgi:hypothetical protein
MILTDSITQWTRHNTEKCECLQRQKFAGCVARMHRGKGTVVCLFLMPHGESIIPQKEPVLVSNFSFDLVRNSNPKPSLPALHCLLSFDFNLCFQFVMFHIFSFLNNFLKFGELRHGFTRCVTSYAYLNLANSKFCQVINSATGITLFP